MNTLKLLSFTTTIAFRKDADKFRRAAFPAGLAQFVIEDDFSVVCNLCTSVLLLYCTVTYCIDLSPVPYDPCLLWVPPQEVPPVLLCVFFDSLTLAFCASHYHSVRTLVLYGDCQPMFMGPTFPTDNKSISLKILF